MNIWAGLLPIELKTGDPIDDDRLDNGALPPDNVSNYTRRSWRK